MQAADLGWLKLNGEIRQRLESPTAINLVSQSSDTYYLSRMRLGATVRVLSWFHVFSEVQDARAWNHNSPVSGSSQDPLDLRQAYLDVGGREQGRWNVRIGRQAWRYGAGRLIADPAWGNTGQAFDGFRTRLQQAWFRVDAFAARPVRFDAKKFDRADSSEMLWGVYSVLQPRSWKGAIEPYLFRKSRANVRNELGESGLLDLRAIGVRAVGPTAPKGWEVELVNEHGRHSGGTVLAWAAYATTYWEMGTQKWQPRIGITYMYASGDADPTDGRKQTFDTLYPSSHLRNGATDRLGWANLHDAHASAEWKLNRSWRLTTGAHDFRLATVKDSLYSKNGIPLRTNRRATSAHIGWEAYLFVEWQRDQHWTAGAGYAHLFQGSYLRQSAAAGATQPYVCLAYRF